MPGRCPCGVAALLALGAAASAYATMRNLNLSKQGQLTDRYKDAVAQLGDDQIAVRLGGIYALERLTKDSPPDQPTIMEVLGAFVRQQPFVERVDHVDQLAGDGGPG